MIFAEGLALPSPSLQPDRSAQKKTGGFGGMGPAESWVTTNNDISERLFHALVNVRERSVKSL